MGMYPNMIQPIPFIKHKNKHPTGAGQEIINNPNEKNEETEQKKEEKNEEKNEQNIQNQMQEEPKEDI